MLATEVGLLLEAYRALDEQDDILFYRENLEDLALFSPGSMAAKNTLTRYTAAVSKGLVLPTYNFLGRSEYLLASPGAKFDIANEVFSVGAKKAYSMTAEGSNLLYNEKLKRGGSTARLVMPSPDNDRLESLTANIAKRAVEEDSITSSQNLMERGMDQMVKAGPRDAVTATVGEYENTGVQMKAFRETRSKESCEYCEYFDGRRVFTVGTGEIYETRKKGGLGEKTGNKRERRRAWEEGDGIQKFHDSCSCELVVYAD